MKLETLASVGATGIALLALVASQFPPLYTYFQSARIEVSAPAEFVFRCSPRGVFVSLRLPVQNTGDAFADISVLGLDISGATGALVKQFEAPLIQSEQTNPITQQPQFVPFAGIPVAPSERIVLHAAFHPGLDGLDIAAFRRIAEAVQDSSNAHYERFGYEGPAFTIDDDLALDFAKILAPQNSWFFDAAEAVRLRIGWVDDDGDSFSIENEYSFVLPDGAAEAIRDRYAPERLSKDPEFFEGCTVPVDLTPS